MATEISDVCGITGFVIKHTNPNEAKLFGGFFTLRKPEVYEEDHFPYRLFNGMLVDYEGPSQINGKISPVKLEFNRIYEESRNSISYQFNRNVDGIWVGSYGDNSVKDRRALAVAKLNLAWKNVDMNIPTAENPGILARDIAKKLADEGILRIVFNEDKEF